MSFKITFAESAKEFVLDAFDKSVDSEGYIVNKSNKDVRVLNTQGNEVHLSQFGGVRKGSRIFFEDDIDSVIDLIDNYAE